MQVHDQTETRRGNGEEKAENTGAAQLGRIFVGNYDNGIVVTNIDHAITMAGQAVGKLAQKCIDVAPRAVHYLRPDEAAVLYEPLPDAYAAYLRDLYGFRPMTFSPKARYTDTSQPLSLIENMLDDQELLENVGRVGKRHGWHITPFIQHPSVFELGRRTGLPVQGMSEESVLGNRVAELNDKARFQTVCRKLGIPIPDSLHVSGLSDVLRLARKIFAMTGSVMLRHALGAGGLGNIEATQELLDQAGNQRLEEYLLERMQPLAIWEHGMVLVEPFLKVRHSPATLYRITPDRLRLVSHSMQIISGTSCYIGSIAPSGLPTDLVDSMVSMSKRYAAYVRSQGGYGYCGIDWGILHDGSLIAFESNFRFGGMIHVNEIKRRLRSDNAQGAVTVSNDALKVGKATNFTTVHDLMADRKLHWDVDSGEGVVVTIPPAGGSMGYVVLAETIRRAMEFNAAMQQLASDLPF
ncbi:MAG: hypothetical protein WC551_03365 [Patescibacteria group bacterium]